MSGAALLARVIATGRIHGVVSDNFVEEADQTVKADFIEVIEGEYGTLHARRDDIEGRRAWQQVHECHHLRTGFP
ncbi:hypothetical protein [Streptomyces rhizosphaericus]|uniref:hypothetical protein n=1 Tax=Streptomyces rhizosphaericus TaxID=114699 RepID=UPI001C3F72DD|nr:hypothetical protein [Streptomyces cangkringensis]